MEIDQRLLKLSQYLRQAVDESGLNVNAFHRRYSVVNGKSVLGASTFAQLVSRPRAFPDKRTFDALSLMLSQARGYEIPASALMKICDLDQPQYEDVEESLEVSDSPKRAELLLRQFKALPYEDRSRIAPDLLRVLADDGEYESLDDLGKLAFLVRRERITQGKGAAAFATEFVGVPVPIIEAILRRERVKINKPQFLAIASRVRDIDGKLMLDEDEARRSLFCRVLAPHLFVESE